MSWTRWQALETATAYRGAAVYQVRVADGAAKPIPVPRFLGTDQAGLLCIGKSGNMEVRRRKFVGGIKNRASHSEAELLYLLLRYSRLEERLPGHQIQYRYRRETNATAAGKAESRFIKAYVREFGEPPPLNSAIPDRLRGWDE